MQAVFGNEPRKRGFRSGLWDITGGLRLDSVQRVCMVIKDSTLIFYVRPPPKLLCIQNRKTPPAVYPTFVTVPNRTSSTRPYRPRGSFAAHKSIKGFWTASLRDEVKIICGQALVGCDKLDWIFTLWSRSSKTNAVPLYAVRQGHYWHPSYTKSPLKPLKLFQPFVEPLLFNTLFWLWICHDPDG